MKKLTAPQIALLGTADSSAGNRVRLARQLLDLTQEEVAAAMDVSQSFVSELERSRANNPLIEGKLADYFGCAIEDLFPSRNESAVA